MLALGSLLDGAGAFRAESEVGDLALHGGRAERLRPPSTTSPSCRRNAGQARRRHRDVLRQSGTAAALAVQLQALRAVGARRSCEKYGARRGVRRRHRVHQVVLGGVEQSRARRCTRSIRGCRAWASRASALLGGRTALGSENRNLPGFVVLGNGAARRQGAGRRTGARAFLPSSYQGTLFPPRTGRRS